MSKDTAMSGWTRINDENVIQVWVNDATNQVYHISPANIAKFSAVLVKFADVLKYSHTIVNK